MSKSATLISLLVARFALAQPSRGEDDSAALVEDGRRALLAHQLDDAAKALDQAIALNPRRVEAYVLRSAVFAARKQYKDGIALMRKAQELAPTDLDVLGALGTDLVLAGEPDTGIPMLEQVVGKEPERYDAELVLGRYYHDGGRWPEAVRALETYFTHRPNALAKDDARYRIDLADAYLRLHQPQVALALFDKSATENPSDVRAKLGVAWATAAIDCKKAHPLLSDLLPRVDKYPDILLVDAQCMLALGNVDAAQMRAKSYLEHVPKAAAAHALVGEAAAAKGDLQGAMEELGKARELEPDKRRWSVRLAVVLRRGNKPRDGLALLEQLGPPSAPAVDPDWWVELGESLLAAGESQQAVQRLAPAMADLQGDANARVVYGQALLASGQAADAVRALDGIESPRGKKLLAQALVDVAGARLVQDDAQTAAPMLERAVSLDPTPLALRDLGIADLALGKNAEAAPVLDRVVKAEPDGVALMLAGRAHALAGDIAAARPLYDKAVADKAHGVDAAIDWAASELAGGDPAIAVTALDKVKSTDARYKTALATARHAAGLAALEKGNGARAVELLRGAGDSLAAKCDLAVATVVAGDPGAALSALKAIRGQSCPFPAPADTQAAPILAAFVDGLEPGHAAKALDQLQKFSATGVAAALLGTAVRVVALSAAADAYRAGDLAGAKRFTAAAKGVSAKVGADEVALDLAVIDLADGQLDSAIGALEHSRLPEALVHLGIAYEKKGDQGKALDAWRRAKKLGVRFPALDGWIDAKARVYGDNP